MYELRAAFDGAKLQVALADTAGGALQSRSLFRILGQRGSAQEVPIATADTRADGLHLYGAAHGFQAEALWTLRNGSYTRYYDVTMQVRYDGEPLAAGLQTAFTVAGAGRPTWLIPGAFYKENRLPQNQRIYPRYDFDGGNPEQMVASSWSFRADRSATPAVFAWNEDCCAALATAEMSALGLTGMGFAGNSEGTAIWLNFPYREEPVVFAEPGRPAPADCPLYQWTPGTRVTLRYRVYLSGPDRHAYDPFVRELYDLDRESNPLRPWVGITEAAELTAWGLWRWHYHPEHQILMETAAFDREGNRNGDRVHMHVGWVSGVPYAYSLLTYGRKHGEDRYVEAALAVLDKIATGIAPCGLFWGEWRDDRGWSQGWTPNKKWLQARTLAEATLFMIRALRSEGGAGSHPSWQQAVLSNLRFIRDHQRADGNFGSYYHVDTGEVVEWDGAGGILWIAALLEGASLFADDSFREAAIRAGAYYARFIRDEFIYGAPEDVHLTPTSEDGYNALMAYVLLYEADRRQGWLELARQAADWTMTFRWTYNLTFPTHSMLRQFDFRSRGADHASPSNMHLHNYGLICLPEMLRLWRHTGDHYYLNRTRDNLACFLQFIAREDGDFNAYKGMVTERYYNTNCFQPKGMMLTLSHAWSVGVTLYAAQEAAPYEAALGLRVE